MPTQFHASDYEIHDLREPHHSLPIQGGMGVPGYDRRSRMFSTPCNNDGSNNAAAAAASSSEVAAYAWSKTTTRGPKAAGGKGGGKASADKGERAPFLGKILNSSEYRAEIWSESVGSPSDTHIDLNLPTPPENCPIK